jgi:hypothetical protein
MIGLFTKKGRQVAYIPNLRTKCQGRTMVKRGAFEMTWMSLSPDGRLNGAVHVTTLDTNTNIVPRRQSTLVRTKLALQNKALMEDLLQLNPRRQGDIADLVLLLATTSFRFVTFSQL